jgi:hypothetical protein
MTEIQNRSLRTARLVVYFINTAALIMLPIKMFIGIITNDDLIVVAMILLVVNALFARLRRRSIN